MKIKIIIFLCTILCSFALRSQTLLAEYNFTGGSGADNSGNLNHGTVYGASTTGNVLVIGSNINDYFKAPSTLLHNRQAFSISFGVKFTEFNVSENYPTNTIMTTDNHQLVGAIALSYQKDINSWRLAFNGSLYDFFDNTLLIEQWYCVTLTRDSIGKITLYLNGVQYSSTYSNNSLTYVNSFILGQETDCVGGCFAVNQSGNGVIDNFKIYSGTIDQETVNSNCRTCEQCIRVGIGEISVWNAGDSQVYPNPFINKIRVTVPVNCEYTLSDGLGRSLMSGNLQEGDNSLTLNSLPKGFYHLTLKTSGNQRSYKIIKSE